jgi:hypothetical protein
MSSKYKDTEWYWRKRIATEIERKVAYDVEFKGLHDADARLIHEEIVDKVVLKGAAEDVGFTTSA